MERTQFQARVVSNNQITIPKEVREIWELQIKDIVTVEIISVKRWGV